MRDPDKLVKEWLIRADDDLAYAQVGFRETDLYANVCFSCQQAFEKYLKAFLLVRDIDFPNTHDLTKLLELCRKSDPAFVEFEDAASTLTPYNIAARYPDIGDIQFSSDQAGEALRLTESLQDFVKNKLL